MRLSSVAVLACCGLLGACSIDRSGLAPEGGLDASFDAPADGYVPPPDGCRPETETCNGADDDCDGHLDEDFDLRSDPSHCGRCDGACPSGPNARAACDDGTCALACREGWLDCDAEPENGCEAQPSEATSCGGCSNTCTEPTPFCAGDGAGGFECVADCPPGQTQCGDSCVDTDTNASHCGGCGNECAFDHALAICSGGSCELDACHEDWGDCDGNPDNGCERSLTTLSDCGGCGDACSLDHASESCASGSCTLDSCDGGWDDCDSDPDNGCETELGTDSDCDSCGDTCSGSATCMSGSCVDTCPDGCTCDLACDETGCRCDGGCPCTIDCADDCDPECRDAGTTCTVEATGISNLDDFMCRSGADCTIEASGASNVIGECRDAGTTCTVDCSSTSNCNVDCTHGAQCLVDCADTDPSNCGFGICAGSPVTDCGDGILVCNRACP